MTTALPISYMAYLSPPGFDWHNPRVIPRQRCRLLPSIRQALRRILVEDGAAIEAILFMMARRCGLSGGNGEQLMR